MMDAQIGLKLNFGFNYDFLQSAEAIILANYLPIPQATLEDTDARMT